MMVPGLCRLQCRECGLRVADLAEENHVRTLPHRGAQRGGEVFRIQPDLALGEERVFVLEKELDGILQRDDVFGLVFVDPVQAGGDGG